MAKDRIEYLQELERKLVLLVDQTHLAITGKIRESIDEYLSVGEYGLAFEEICEYVREGGITVTGESAEFIKFLSSSMNIDC